MNNANLFYEVSRFAQFVLWCERSEHHKTNPTPKNGSRHYLALPAHHPEKNSKIEVERMKNGIQKNTVEKKSRSAWDATAYNGRFCEMAALAPQKRQCELGSYYPARTFVKPPPRKAAWTLPASVDSANKIRSY